MAAGRILFGLFIVGLAVLAVVAPAGALKPKSGDWFSAPVDPKDENNLSSVQFKLVNGGKKLKKVTIYWRCRKLSGYHNFSNPPIPIGVKKRKFKLIGATTPPAGQSTKDLTLKGKFTSAKSARYSMKLEGCGPKTKGKLSYAGS